MSGQKKFVLYTEESLATTSSPTTFDMSKRYSGLSSVSGDTATSTMNKSNGIQISTTSTAIVAHTSPYYYEKHMLQDNYDDQGLRQGSWEVGLCNCLACLPMTFGFCFALPCVSVAQISARLGLRSYRAALVWQLIYSILVIGLPIAAYFLLIKMQSYPENKTETTKAPTSTLAAKGDKSDDKKPVDTAETLVMLGLWTTFVGWVVALLIVALSLADLRLKIRSRCQIPKSRLGDFGQVVFMPTCAIAQMSSHLRCLRPGRYTFQCPETLPPYQY